MGGVLVDVYAVERSDKDGNLEGWNYVLECPPDLKEDTLDESPLMFSSQGDELEARRAGLPTASEQLTEGRELFSPVVIHPRLGKVACYWHPISLVPPQEGGHPTLDEAVLCFEENLASWLAGFGHQAVFHHHEEPPFWRYDT